MVSIDTLKKTAVEFVEQIGKDCIKLDADIINENSANVHTKVQMLTADINKLCAIVGIIETEIERNKKP